MNYIKPLFRRGNKIIKCMCDGKEVIKCTSSATSKPLSSGVYDLITMARRRFRLSTNNDHVREIPTLGDNAKSI